SILGHAVRSLADANEFGRSADEAERLLSASVAPRSPLKAWGTLLGMLRDRRGALTQPDKPGTASLQLRALRLLLELEPPAYLLEELEPRITSLAAVATETAVVHELRALWALKRGNGTQAFASAEEWVRACSDDPSAYVARCRAAVLAGNVD